MRPRNLPARHALVGLLRRGPQGAAEIAQALGVSRRTALRLIDELAGSVLSAGQASRRRYALRRPLRGDAQAQRLFQVDATGRVHDVGELALVEPTGSHCDFAALAWPTDGASSHGWWDGLPYPLYDMQPQGFLGRGFARREHRHLEVASEPRDWSDDDIVFVLSRRGADTSGNLILGEAALRLFQAEWADPAKVLTPANTSAAYVALADEAVASGTAGSSAGGEFPKFAALRDGRGSRTPHVLVKFSGRANSEATQRWSDLLVCEHLALQQAAGLPGVAAARSRVVLADGRTFMESERFDRHGRFGRSPLVTLQALSGHLLGLGTQDWRVHAQALVQQQWLDPDDAAAVQRLWWFGRLIANTDMHLGNLSFIPADGRLRLAPAYDMLPMAYAPLGGGEVPVVQARFELPLPAEGSAWKAACKAALRFWDTAAADARISPDFRALCRANLTVLNRLGQAV